jgi:hypothetical protein
VWILTSLGRPDRIRKVVESYDWSAQSRVILALWQGDKRLPEYLAQKWPGGWQIKIVPMRGNGPTYNDIFSMYPDEPCYGFLADDAILDEQGMLRILEQSAGDWNLSYANDKHWGAKLPTMPCIGGELARAVGYLAPTALLHWAIDNAWGTLGERLGCLRYHPELTYTHLNPVWGTAPDDPTYQWARALSPEWERVYRSWMVNEMPLAIERVRAARMVEA